MTFVQANFLYFLVIVFIVFYICPVKFRWIVLLAASLVFYGIAGLEYLPFIFVTSFSVWLAGKRMGGIYEAQDKECNAEELSKKEKRELKERAKAKCRRVLIALLVLNVGILCACKFTRYFIGPINSLLTNLGGKGTFSAEYIIVPLGISYYTFSSLSYLMDVYWKRISHEKNYFRFLLYVSYFPHILQGPIERYSRLGERLKQELRFDFTRVSFGVQLIVWGFIKKLVLANRLDVFITGIYTRQAELHGFLFLVAMILDVVYIYADFSGCMDIARGVSQIFGVELDLNFNHPFSSKTIDEFWRRWHMSMGSWFKDYVYFPVSTSKLVKNISRSTKNRLPNHISKMLVTALPVTITWVLTGLWHGTGKTYLMWGIYYAFIILMSVAFGDDLHQLAVKAGIKTETESWKLFQMFRTTVIFMFGRVLTRPEGLWRTKIILKSLVTDFNPWVLFDGSLYQYGFTKDDMKISIFFIILFGVVSCYQQRGSVREWIARQGIVFRYMIYILAVLSVVVFGIYGPGFNAASFAYMAY